MRFFCFAPFSTRAIASLEQHTFHPEDVLVVADVPLSCPQSLFPLDQRFIMASRSWWAAFFVVLSVCSVYGFVMASIRRRES